MLYGNSSTKTFQPIIILNLLHFSFPPFRDNALKWFPLDSEPYSDALLMKAVCSHFVLPQLFCSLEPGVALVGGRIISSCEVPLGDRVAKLSSVLAEFESDLLSEPLFHGAFCTRSSEIEISGLILPELKQKLDSGLYVSLKPFLTDIHALVRSFCLLMWNLIRILVCRCVTAPGLSSFQHIRTHGDTACFAQVA